MFFGRLLNSLGVQYLKLLMNVMPIHLFDFFSHLVFWDHMSVSP